MRPLLLALLFASAALRADIPFFWLDRPSGRLNPNDPQSPLHVAAAPLPVAPPPPASCGSPCATCIKYEDFEKPLVGYYTYADTANGSSSSGVLVSTDYSTCAQSLRATVSVGSGYYAAVGFGSNFYASGVINATGAHYLRLWLKAAAPVDFKVSFSEFRGTPAGPADEGWTSPSQHYGSPGSWQAFQVLLSDFSENTYNSACSPNCATLGNNTMDLDVVGAVDLNFTTAGFSGDVYIDDVAFDTTAPPPPPPPGPTISFNGFEDGAACGGYTYADSASSMAETVDPAAAHTGGQGLRLSANTDVPGFAWGAGAGTQPPGCATVDASGANTLCFWIKATNTGSAGSVSYVITLSENNVPVTWPALDPANEQWRSPSQTLSSFGAWTQVCLPLSGFTENLNSAACSPNCAALGNNAMDKNVLSNWDLAITTAGFNGTLDIDDIQLQ